MSSDAPKPDVLPWERQDGEPELAYEAFKGYVYQTPPRRLAHSSARHGTGQLSSLYKEWRWQERATAYDRHVQRIRDDEREALLKQDEKARLVKMLEVLEGAGEVINREMTKLLRDTQKSEAFGLVRVSDLNKLMGTWITMQRLIHGQSTENVAISADLQNLTVDEVRELQRLQAKLAGEDGEDPGAVH